jgi:FkbM family methyltransferase
MRERLVYAVTRLPHRLVGVAWPVVRLGARRGRHFFFRTRVYGREVIQGGVFGLQEQAVGLRLHDFEPETARAVAHLLAPCETRPILDVGANAGQSLLVFKALCPDAPVHCFEAIPALAAFLEALVRRNGFSDCRVVHAAVGDRAGGQALIRYGASETLTASTVLHRAALDRQARVPATTLDDHAARTGLGAPALVKIDVEGGELEVVRGAMGLLGRHRPPLVLELLDGGGDLAWDARRQALEGLLRPLGYRFARIGPGGRLEPQDPVVPDPTYRYLNYLVAAADGAAARRA